MNKEYKKLIFDYIQAKDKNQPGLMTSVFSKDASLVMEVLTDNITFPSYVAGVDAITDTLVNKFNQSYDNIYTLCLTDTVEQNENRLSCRWLVGMIEKTTGALRIGFGVYGWQFENDGQQRVKHLTITIENMTVLSEKYRTEVMSWIDDIPYPWAPSSAVTKSIPNIVLLKPLIIFLSEKEK